MPRAPPNSDSLPNARRFSLMQSFHPTPSFRKNHFGLQLSLNSLNSSGAEPERAQPLSRTGTMIASRIAGRACMAGLLLAAWSAPTRASNLALSPGTHDIFEKSYCFDLDGDIVCA